MGKQLCPACSSSDLQQGNKVLTISKYGLSESRDVAFLFCPACKVEFSQQDDEAIRRDMGKDLEQRNVRLLLEQMAQGETSFASLERALSLPKRTLSKWKQGSTRPSEAGMLLVNLLNLMPWLSQVVAHDFDPELAFRLQWENLCKSIDSLPAHVVEAGYEQVIASYVRQEGEEELLTLEDIGDIAWL